MQIPDGDTDLPWYCCLHPEPHLASCLAAEEPHDGNTAPAASADVAGLCYSSCAGFIPYTHTAAASSRRSGGGGAAGSDKVHADNVAHFNVVISSAVAGGEAEGSLSVLHWLSKQDPHKLVTGVTVPKDLRAAAPDYGKQHSIMVRST